MKRKRNGDLEKGGNKKRKLTNEEEEGESGNISQNENETEEIEEIEIVPIIEPIPIETPNNEGEEIEIFVPVEIEQNGTTETNTVENRDDSLPQNFNAENHVIQLLGPGEVVVEEDNEDDDDDDDTIVLSRENLLNRLLATFFDGDLPENIINRTQTPNNTNTENTNTGGQQPQEVQNGRANAETQVNEQMIIEQLEQRFNDLEEEERTDENYSRMLQRQEIIRSIFRPRNGLFGQRQELMRSVENNMAQENHDLFDMQFREIHEEDYEELCKLDENNKRDVLKSEDDFTKIVKDFRFGKKLRKSRRGRPKKKVENQKNCTICMDEFVANEKLKRLIGCSHVFHEKCLRNWVTKYKRNCPLCKMEVIVPKKKKRKRRKRDLTNFVPRRSERIKRMVDAKQKKSKGKGKRRGKK